jgi:phage portal protein BeeE
MASPFAWLKSFFGARLTESAPSAGGLLTGVLTSGEAPRRGTKELLDAYKRLPWLHTVVRRIAQDVSGTRWRVWRMPRARIERSSSHPMARRFGVGRSMRTERRGWLGYAPEGAVEVETHPMLDVLADPNPVLSPMSVWWVAQGLLDLKGECPIVIERAKSGAPLELWPVPPHWLAETPTTREPSYRFQWNTWHTRVPAEDVLYLRHPDLSSPYQRGAGTGEAAADEIDIDEFAAKHLKSFFYNRGLPDAFVSIEGVENEDDARFYEQKLRSKHQGVGKGFQFHITAGKVDVKELGNTFRESQIVELREGQRDLFVQLFNVPPEVLGIIANSNRATINAADYLYTKNVLCPRLDFMADGLTSLLDDPSLVVGYESPVPSDDEFALRVMQTQPTVFTKNEWRRLAGVPEIAGWDDEFPSAPAPSFGSPALPSGAPGDDLDEPEPTDDEADDDAARGLLRLARRSRRLAR